MGETFVRFEECRGGTRIVGFALLKTQTVAG